MCKVLAVVGVKPENDALLWKFIEAAANPMVEADKDGYGYMAISQDGKMFGEKWFNPKNRFRLREDVSEDARLYKQVFGDCISLNPGYKFLGDAEGWGTSTASVIAHARFATCGKELDNVHPFYIDDVALIHNGIISNHHEHEKCISTCDSEAILTRYLVGGIRENPEKFQKEVADELEGSYACAVLSPTALDIFRNAGADLFVARLTRLDAWVFATTKEILYRGAAAIKAKLGPVVELKAGSFIRLHPITGELLHRQEFTSSYSRVWTPTARTTYYPASTQAALDQGRPTVAEILAAEEGNDWKWPKEQNNPEGKQ